MNTGGAPPPLATAARPAAGDGAFASAAAHAAAVRDGRVSCRELAELYIGRIQAHNPGLHAIVTDNEADARRTACERDDDLRHGIVRGPLHGVPVTVKEAFDLAGLPTTVNSLLLRHNIAAADALVVRRLKQAGATILGKTNVPTMLADYQCCGQLFPTANNPHDVTRTPGGSTGGGAAAVAAGLTTVEIGSDLAGSLRVPAHFCGVFGLKPTENAALCGDGHVPPLPASRGGFVAMAAVGPLARTMVDIELAYRIISQPARQHACHDRDELQATTTLADCRVAWFDDVGTVACGDDTKRVLQAFLRMLEAGGVRTEKRPFDQAWLDMAYEIWGVLFGLMAGQDEPWIARQWMKRQSGRMQMESAINLRRPLRTGLDIRFRDYSRALKRRSELVQALQRRFDDYDFIIGPVAAGPAFAHNPRYRPIGLDGRSLAYRDYALPFAIIYNACGNPALVVPAGRSADGLPIGVQIAAPHHAERELIRFGKLIEQLGVVCTTPAGYQPA